MKDSFKIPTGSPSTYIGSTLLRVLPYGATVRGTEKVLRFRLLPGLLLHQRDTHLLGEPRHSLKITHRGEIFKRGGGRTPMRDSCENSPVAQPVQFA